MSASARAKALFVAGMMSNYQGDHLSAEPLVQESLRLFKELGDKLGTAYALSNAGYVALGRGRYQQAITVIEEAADLFLEEGEVNQTVSREHARITWDGAEACYWLRDEGSAYGTRIFRDGRSIDVSGRDPRGVRRMIARLSELLRTTLDGADEHVRYGSGFAVQQLPGTGSVVPSISAVAWTAGIPFRSVVSA